MCEIKAAAAEYRAVSWCPNIRPRHMFPNYAFRGWTLTSAVASAESASRLYSEALVRLNSQRPR